VAADHPEVVRRLTPLAEKAREELGDVDRPGKGRRPVGRVANPTPRILSVNAPTARMRPEAACIMTGSRHPIDVGFQEG